MKKSNNRIPVAQIATETSNEELSSTSAHNSDHIPTALIVSEEGEVENDEAFENYHLLNNEPINNSSSSSAAAAVADSIGGSGITAYSSRSSNIYRPGGSSNDNGISSLSSTGNYPFASSFQEESARRRRIATGTSSRNDEYNASGYYSYNAPSTANSTGLYQSDIRSDSYQQRGINATSSTTNTTTTTNNGVRYQILGNHSQPYSRSVNSSNTTAASSSTTTSSQRYRRSGTCCRDDGSCDTCGPFLAECFVEGLCQLCCTIICAAIVGE